ncbi:MAG: sugar phosphate isomerase/epimerase [Bacteroidota bacterium]|nr:sugar phosphate isomerase/epimerase [Bacteroidota bacterium]
MSTRRQFLREASLVSLALASKPGAFASPFIKTAPKLSLQLYTVRNEIEKDFEGSVDKLAAMGVRHVETAFWPKHISLQQAADALKKAGIKVSSCHIEIPVGDKKDIFLETARAFDCKKMIWHGWPEDKRYSSLEGTKELIGIYNEASRFAKENGLQFGLHNHWWEYRNKAGDRPVYEWLLQETSPDIFFELDTYWIKTAGFDPATIIQKFGKRARLLHMKDGPAQWHPSLAEDNPDPMVAVGKGTQNIPAIAKAALANVEWMVIEMDKVNGDPFAAIKESRDYLLQHGFATEG